MNKFLQFNELIEIGKAFKDCESYLIALEYFDKAIELSCILPINKNRILEAYDLRGNTKIFLNKSLLKKFLSFCKRFKFEARFCKDSFIFVDTLYLCEKY